MLPVWVTYTHHVWWAVQSMVPVATCTRWRSYTRWRWVMTPFPWKDVYTGMYPLDRGGTTISRARRTLASASRAAPVLLGWFALAPTEDGDLISI